MRPSEDGVNSKIFKQAQKRAYLNLNLSLRSIRQRDDRIVRVHLDDGDRPVRIWDRLNNRWSILTAAGHLKQKFPILTR